MGFAEDDDKRTVLAPLLAEDGPTDLDIGGIAAAVASAHPGDSRVVDLAGQPLINALTGLRDVAAARSSVDPGHRMVVCGAAAAHLALWRLHMLVPTATVDPATKTALKLGLVQLTAKVRMVLHADGGPCCCHSPTSFT